MLASSLKPLLDFFFERSSSHQPLHSFPTRRSSDLGPPPTRRLAARRRPSAPRRTPGPPAGLPLADRECRSEEHTSELQSRGHLVCRLLLEKKNRGYGRRAISSS